MDARGLLIEGTKHRSGSWGPYIAGLRGRTPFLYGSLVGILVTFLRSASMDSCFFRSASKS